jgi:transposase
VEYLAIIINEEKRGNEKVWKWRYTFLNIETDKEDWFYSNKKVNYIPRIIGKLKLSEGNSFRFYQSFNQSEFKPYKENEKEKSLTQLEKNADQGIEKLDNYFAKKMVGDDPQDLLGIFNALHKIDKNWTKTATRFKKSDRTLRRWRKKLTNWIPKVLKKKGRKRIMDEDDLLLLLFLTNSPKYNTKTQQWKSDYIFKKTGRQYSQQVVSYNLKRYSDFTRKRATKRYSEQDLEKIRQFLKKYSWIYSLPNCLAVDEFSVHLGEAPRYVWSRRGCPEAVPRKGRGVNYTLILCVRNVEKQAVVSYKLIKNIKSKERKNKGTDAMDFYNFLKNIKLPTNEQYYLLLDNSRIHYTTKDLEELGLSMEELTSQKNFTLVYLPGYTPELNPIELCFNTVRHFIEELPTNTEEELKETIDKIINMINKKDLTKYFRHCQEFFSFDKNGH